MWNKSERNEQERRMTTTRTPRPNWRIAAWTLVMAMTALCGSASAAQWWRRGTNNGVVVYVDINFGGRSATFTSDMPNTASGGWNDNISSLRIPSGQVWEICQDVNYGNECQSVSGSVSDLRTIGWNDRISSMRRINAAYQGRRRGENGSQGNGNGDYRDRRSGGAIGTAGYSTSVTVYVDPNYRGQSATFRDDTPNLVPLNLNDKVSSIRISDGDAWEVCQDIDYGNQCQVLTSSVADLRSMGWNDRISSLRRASNGRYRDGGYQGPRQGGVFQPNAQQGLLFFDGDNFRGRSTLVTGGSSNMRFAAWQGSVQIRGGGTWEVCDNSGGCVTINQDVSDLSQLGLNDRITSARVVNQYRRDRD